MEKNGTRNGIVGHSSESKPGKSKVNTPLKDRERYIQYGSVNVMDPLLVAGDSELSKCDRLGICLRSLKIEPITFLFCFAFVLNFSCLTNMMMMKSCLYHFNYTYRVCSNLSNYPTEKTVVEIYANNYTMYYSLMGLLGAVMMIFIAPWSDKYSRKLPLFLALAGSTVADIGLALCAYYFESEVYLIVLTKIPSEIFGGYICIFTIIYSHASDVSSKEARTMKYTIVEVAFSLGMALGGLSGGMVYWYFGYFYIFVISFFIHALTLPWLLFVVDETTGLDSIATWKEKLKDLFVFESLLKGWKASIRVRKNKGRTLILLYLASMSIAVLSYESLTGVNYVYVHHLFNWDPAIYNSINTMFSLTSMVILAVVVFVLVQIFKASDFVLGLVGVVSMMAKYIILAFAHYGVYMYYLGYAAGYINGLVPLAVRSSVSKVVERDEIGKVFSFLATCEAIVPLFGIIIITKVFNATINITPNIGYLMLSALLLVPLGTFLWGFCCLRKIHRDQEETTSV